MEDVELTFSESALDAIAKKAVERKTGARGLRSIMENILLNPMFDLPEMHGIEEVVINREVAEDSGKPLFIYAERKSELDKPA